MYNRGNKLTLPEDMEEDDAPIIEAGSDWDSISRILSPYQTSRTLNVSAPFVTLSSDTEMPKQKDFPTISLIGSGRSSGSSTCVEFQVNQVSAYKNTHIFVSKPNITSS